MSVAVEDVVAAGNVGVGREGQDSHSWKRMLVRATRATLLLALPSFLTASCVQLRGPCMACGRRRLNVCMCLKHGPRHFHAALSSRRESSISSRVSICCTGLLVVLVVICEFEYTND